MITLSAKEKNDQKGHENSSLIDDNKKVRGRSEWVDNMRTIAIITVIGVHVVAPALAAKNNLQFTSNAIWRTANIYDALFRFCVPIFVMITGALLLPNPIGLGPFLKKRLKRIMLPFIFWSLIYMVFNILLKIRDEGTTNAFTHFGFWLSTQITQGSSVHLWYVYMIIGLYLFVPILQPWIKEAGNKSIIYFLSIWLISLIIKQQHIFTAPAYLDLSNFSGYLGYMVLGYFLAYRIIITNYTRYLAAFLLLLGFSITLAGHFIVFKSGIPEASEIYNYLSIDMILTASGIFILVKNWKPKLNNAAISKIRDTVSRYSYGIYLGHLLILDILWHFKIDYALVTPIIGIPINMLVCLALTCMMIYLINKLPYGKYVSGISG